MCYELSTTVWCFIIHTALHHATGKSLWCACAISFPSWWPNYGGEDGARISQRQKRFFSCLSVVGSQQSSSLAAQTAPSHATTEHKPLFLYELHKPSKPDWWIDTKIISAGWLQVRLKEQQQTLPIVFLNMSPFCAAALRASSWKLLNFPERLWWCHWCFFFLNQPIIYYTQGDVIHHIFVSMDRVMHSQPPCSMSDRWSHYFCTPPALLCPKNTTWTQALSQVSTAEN